MNVFSASRCYAQVCNHQIRIGSRNQKFYLQQRITFRQNDRRHNTVRIRDGSLFQQSTKTRGTYVLSEFSRNESFQTPPRRNLASASGSSPGYIPPIKGLAASLPKSWIPYAELIRLDKPTGTFYLFFPCLFSTLLAAPLAIPIATPWEVTKASGLFFLGALIMRSAGCTINDLWDRNLDPHVERTRFRPIARGAVTPQRAIIFTGAQLLAGLGILVQFPTHCLWYGVPSLLLVGIYPLAKRVTNYPQFVLGLTFSWGAMMGFSALNIDILGNNNILAAATALYSSCVAWTVVYDMIYAHMDIRDDAAAGIKSIALRHEQNTKAILSGLAAIQVVLLAIAGAAAGARPIFFVGTCGSAILTLGSMILLVRLKEVENCWWWFKNGCWLTGGGITLGLLGEYLARIFGLYDTSDPHMVANTESADVSPMK